MKSVSRKAVLFILLRLLANACECANVYNFKGKETFENSTVVLDHIPFKDNTFTYAACDLNAVERQRVNCSVYYKSFNVHRGLNAYSCRLSVEASDGQEVTSAFRVKRLFDEKIIFMWTLSKSDDRDTAEPIGNSTRVLFRLINTKICKILDVNVIKAERITADDVYIVSYAETFDIYFRDKKLCGTFLCGQAHDSKGRLINGPVASYLPARFFRSDVAVCSVKSDSSLKGHFLLSSSKFRLVSSEFGKIKTLMNYPQELVQAHAYSYDNDLLGFCWSPLHKLDRVKCRQFDSQGTLVTSISINLEHQSGPWLAMKNRAVGSIILLTNECNDESWCVENIDTVKFKVLRVQSDGSFNEIYAFHGFDCNNVKEVKSNVYFNNYGRVCAALACHKQENDKSEIHFLFSCEQ